MEHPWESCACITDASWFWAGGKDIKSVNTCLRMLIDAAGGDGNLLLNFGPTQKGTIHPPIKDIYLGMGKWLEKYGESIYGTRGGPYTPGTWGICTRKGHTVYLHVTQTWPGGTFVLPPLPAKITAAKVLGGGTPKIEPSPEGLRITLDPKFHRQPDTVIALETDKPVLDIPVVRTPQEPTLAYDIKVTASSEAKKGAMGSAESVILTRYETGEIKTEFGEEPAKPKGPRKTRKVPPELVKQHPWLRLHRGHFWRCWIAKNDDPKPWIELDFGKPATFRRIALREKVSRIDSFEIQVSTPDGSWKTVYSGGELGNFSLLLPEPVTVRKVRLLVTRYHSDQPDQGPGIHTFDVFRK